MRLPDNDPDDLRLYTRRHLYSALKLTLTLVNKHDGTELIKTATGFILHARHDGGGLYLVSNRHVFDPPYGDPEKLRSYQLESILVEGTAVERGGETTEVSFLLNNPEAVFPPDHELDVAILPLDPYEPPRVAYVVGLDTADLVGEYDIVRDQIGVGSEIVMAGYPNLENGVGQRPLLVPGLVSSDLLHPAEYGGNSYPNRGLCHAFSRGGMSGAPVLTTIIETDSWGDDPPTKIYRRVKILGVNTGHPREKHGPEVLSLFVPATAILELLEALGNRLAGVRNQLGRLAARDVSASDGDEPLEDDDDEPQDDEDPEC